MNNKERDAIIDRTIDDIRIYLSAVTPKNPLFMIDDFAKSYLDYRKHWYGENEQLEYEKWLEEEHARRIV